MENTVLVKPRAIQAFERRFRIEADCLEDVFYIRVASSWTEFFRTAFCFINDTSLKDDNLHEAQNLEISFGGVTFDGRMLHRDVWGSECMLAQGKLGFPVVLDVKTKDLSDGVYLLSWAGSDSRLD